MRVGIAGVGLTGPGLESWAAGQSVLRGDKSYEPSEMRLAPPAILAARERRRTSPSVRLALQVAGEALAHSGLDSADVAVVFGSGNGDTLLVHQLLEALSRPERVVSPTQFHNSVHNAPTGYWSIGTGSHQPCSSIAGHDFTFGAVLLKAIVQVATEWQPVLLAAFDSPYPEPLGTVRSLTGSFGVALVLVPEGGFVAMTGTWCSRGHATADVRPPITAGLQTLWAGNPAARSLPLLEALARGRATDQVAVPAPPDALLRLALVQC